MTLTVLLNFEIKKKIKSVQFYESYFGRKKDHCVGSKIGRLMNGLRDSSVLAGNSKSLSSQLVTIFIHIDMILYQVSKFKGCEVPHLWSFLGVKNLGCLSHNLLCIVCYAIDTCSAMSYVLFLLISIL